MRYGDYNETISYAELCPHLDLDQEYDNEVMYEIWKDDCQQPNNIFADSVSMYEPLSERQRLICDILNRSASFLSLAGSCYIIYCLLGPRREKELNKRLFSRLLLGLSVCDALSSFALLMGHWPKPTDDPYQDNHSDGSFLLQSLGNQATCNVQGLIIQSFYFASLYYTACLCLNFLFSVNYRWTESRLKSTLEPWFHGVSVLFPTSLALLAYFFDMYNPVVLNCGLATSPVNCDLEEDLDCVRGSHLKLWSLTLKFLPIVVSFFTILVSMVLIYRAVRAQEKAVSQFSMRDASEFWSSPPLSHPDASSGDLQSSSQHSLQRQLAAKEVQRRKQRYKDSRMAFSKALLYIGISLSVWLPAFLIAVCETYGADIPYTLWIIRSIMTPIVGLLNAMAYSGIISLAPKGGLRSIISFVSPRIWNSSSNHEGSNDTPNAMRSNLPSSDDDFFGEG